MEVPPGSCCYSVISDNGAEEGHDGHAGGDTNSSYLAEPRPSHQAGESRRVRQRVRILADGGAKQVSGAGEPVPGVVEEAVAELEFFELTRRRDSRAAAIPCRVYLHQLVVKRLVPRGADEKDPLDGGVASYGREYRDGRADDVQISLLVLLIQVLQ